MYTDGQTDIQVDRHSDRLQTLSIYPSPLHLLRGHKNTDLPTENLKTLFQTHTFFSILTLLSHLCFFPHFLICTKCIIYYKTESPKPFTFVVLNAKSRQFHLKVHVYLNSKANCLITPDSAHVIKLRWSHPVYFKCKVTIPHQLTDWISGYFILLPADNTTSLSVILSIIVRWSDEDHKQVTRFVLHHFFTKTQPHHSQIHYLGIPPPTFFDDVGARIS